MVKIFEKINDFEMSLTDDKQKHLSEYRGKKLLMYFYPRANTPGCTTESIEFSEKYRQFESLNCQILGVSADSLRKQQNFKNKFKFCFDLVSDIDEHMCQYFAVIKEKNMYGKKFMGIERSTFLLDEQGVLQHEWRKVKVKGHVDEVLQQLKIYNENIDYRQ